MDLEEDKLLSDKDTVESEDQESKDECCAAIYMLIGTLCQASNWIMVKYLCIFNPEISW